MLSVSTPKTTRARKALTNTTAVRAEECRRSLFKFMTHFWGEINADEPQWNWHIPYLCSQLMQLSNRVARGLPKEHDLIINIPPGTTKSMTCSVMFPTWCWVNWPWMRFIAASYSAQLSQELGEYSRDLVRSDKFKQYFPELEIRQDKDTKSNFRVQRRVFDGDGNVIDIGGGGSRYSSSVGGTLTGFHGHILIVDDPLDPNRAVSETELKTANRWMDQTLSTRKVDKASTPTILIMQRLHQNDSTGHILGKTQKSNFHICLPGEIHGYADKVNPPDLAEYYQDGLLDPKRMGKSVLKELEADLGQYGYAGQIGQDPVPPGGGMFRVDNFQYIDHVPGHNQIVKTVRYWDKAGSKDQGDYTVGIKMHKLTNGKFIVSDVKRGRWASDEREKVIRQTAEADGPNVIVYVEQEPGSGGKESAESTIRSLAGFSVHADRPTGDKVYRADPYSVQINNGNVLFLSGCDWINDFKEEHRFFPYGMYKDQVDAAAACFNKLMGKKRAGVW